MSFTVKSLAETGEIAHVDTAHEATEAVADMRSRKAGAIKVELHHDGEPATSPEPDEGKQEGAL